MTIVATLILVLVMVAGVVLGYSSIASTLPSVDSLRERASQFETTRVYDSQGNVLYEIVDPQAGRRTRVPLDRISPYLIAATIATEDRDFYDHPGFDPVAIVRAILQNLEAGDTVSGASTITQQLVRALILSPEERVQRTNLRKIREIILAAEITRRYTKDEILELYLNENYYGNLAYGIEAASETYFRKRAIDLDLSEAAFLAGLPQAPAVYDIYTNPTDTLNRQSQVLGLMLAAGCVEVSTQPEPICVTAGETAQALVAMRGRTFVPPANNARFPHWVVHIRQQLEAAYGAQVLYRSGFSVYTTLDPNLQVTAEELVATQVAALEDRNVTNGALVALRPSTGEILVMVGSDDFDDPVDGQINMATSPRQPGSSIKPLTYALALEKGWTPATILWDVPTDFPDGANPVYQPVNYDGRFRGPVSVRSALANSYNIPAVKALEYIGIYGDDAFLPFAQAIGLRSLTRDNYGLSLTLGGGEVTLLEMVEAYGNFASGGQRIFPVSILRITDSSGNLICEQALAPGDVRADPPQCQQQPETWRQPVVSPQTAYLISHMLFDNEARTPAFGGNSMLRLPFEASVKTGTTNDNRDNWTVGYTPDLVTGVWVGNADYTPMEGTSGLTGAAPIWNAFMSAVLGDGRATPFTRPADIIERSICGISGAEPSEFCPPEAIRFELFDALRPPPPMERDFWQRAYIDPWTGQRQTADCASYYQNDQLFAQDRIIINVSDPWARRWITENPAGLAWAANYFITEPIAWAPEASCTAASPHPLISLAYPSEGATLLAEPIEIFGQAGATADFDHYFIDFGLSHDPQGWGQVVGPTTQAIQETARLAEWDMSGLPDGPVTLRLTVVSTTGSRAEARVRFNIERPTPTAEPSATATETATVTPTSTLTPTPTATGTSSPVPSRTATAPPSATAQPSVTPPEPSATNPPAPSETSPPPTATDTPEPTAEATTAVPPLAVTDEPPAASETPEPTAETTTAVPPLAATNETPAPSATTAPPTEQASELPTDATTIATDGAPEP